MQITSAATMAPIRKNLVVLSFFLENPLAAVSKPVTRVPPSESSFRLTPRETTSVESMALRIGAAGVAGAGAGAGAEADGGGAGAGAGADAEGMGAPSGINCNSICPRRSVWPGFRTLSEIFSLLMNEPLVELRSLITTSVPRNSTSQ